MILRLPGGEGSPIGAGEVSEDAAVVRAMYRALEEGDTPSLARYADPRIQWVHPMVARLPFDGTRRGLPTVLRAAFRRGTDGAACLRADLPGVWRRVLVVGRFLGDREAEGEPVEEPFLHECFVRGGKVVLICEYPA